MELHEGKMTSKELAEWMGVTYGTYQRNTKARLEKLKYFADFEPCHGGVIIKEIYIAEYVKNFSHDDEIYYKEVKANKNGLSTLSGMTRKLRCDEEFKDISERTLYNRMKNAGIRTFGVTADEDSSGAYGTRHYIWAIKESEFNKYREMNQEERKVYEELKCAFCASEEISNKIEKLSLLQDAYNEGEISKEEIQIDICKDFFYDVIQEFGRRTHQTLVRATYHDLYENRIEFDENNKKMPEIKADSFDFC